MTKAEEMNVLIEIEKLIAKAGTNSYIAMAFDGCVNDARENIENDFACSWKQRAESLQKKSGIIERKSDELERKIDEIEKKYKALKVENDDLIEKLRITEDELIEELHRADAAENQLFEEKCTSDILVDKLEACKESFRNKLDEISALKKEKEDLVSAVENEERRADAAEEEICKLKAKIYDLIFKD